MWIVTGNLYKRVVASLLGMHMDSAVVSSWVIGITGIASLLFAMWKHGRDSALLGTFLAELKALRKSYNDEIEGLRDEIASYRLEVKSLRSRTEAQKDRELRLKEQKLALAQQKEAQRKTEATWDALFKAGKAFGIIEKG
jgi:Skp family chaperone for outer membrane proteins